MVVDENFLQPVVTYDASLAVKNAVLAGNINIQEAAIDDLHAASVNGLLTNMTSTKCMEAYSTNYVSKVRNVLLVTREQAQGNNSLLSLRQWDPSSEITYSWICGDGFSSNPDFQYTPQPICTLSKATEAVSNWTVSGFPISYCVVQEVPESCSLSASVTFMILSFFANLVEACVCA
jgi:hypothetical protein